MSVDDRFQHMFAELRNQRGRPDPQESLSSGGGGSTSGGGMEERVARLERTVDQMSRDVADLRVNVATLTERVSHLPGKGFMVGAAVSTVTGLLALFALLQRVGLLH